MVLSVCLFSSQNCPKSSAKLNLLCAGRGKLSIATTRLEEALSGLTPWPEGDEGKQEGTKRASEKKDVTLKEGAAAMRRKKANDAKATTMPIPTREERCVRFQLRKPLCPRPSRTDRQTDRHMIHSNTDPLAGNRFARP